MVQRARLNATKVTYSSRYCCCIVYAVILNSVGYCIIQVTNICRKCCVMLTPDTLWNKNRAVPVKNTL